MTSYKPHKTSVMAESNGDGNALVVEVEDNVGKIGNTLFLCGYCNWNLMFYCQQRR